MADIGAATLRWLHMLCENEREREAPYYESDAGRRRRIIMNEAASELRGDTRKLVDCLCPFSDAGARASTNPKCPEHGDDR